MSLSRAKPITLALQQGHLRCKSDGQGDSNRNRKWAGLGNGCFHRALSTVCILLIYWQFRHTFSLVVKKPDKYFLKLINYILACEYHTKISKHQHNSPSVVWGIKPWAASTFKNIINFGTERATKARQNLENWKTRKVSNHSCQAARVHPAPKRIPSDLSLQLAPRVASQWGSQDSRFSEQQEKQPFSVEMPAEGRRQLLCHTSPWLLPSPLTGNLGAALGRFPSPHCSTISTTPSSLSNVNLEWSACCFVLGSTED